MVKITGLNEIPELGPVPAGQEYELRIIKASMKKTAGQGGKPVRDYMEIICQVIGEDAAENIFHKLFLPVPSDDEQKTQTMLRMFKEFFIKIGIDLDDEVDTDELCAELTNHEFTAVLGEETYEGRVRNVIKSIQ